MNLKDCLRYFGTPLQYRIKEENEWKLGKICGIQMYDNGAIQVSIEYENYTSFYDLYKISEFRLNYEKEKERNQKIKQIMQFTNQKIHTCRKKQFECRKTWWEEKKLQARKQGISSDVLNTIECLIKEENKPFECTTQEKLLSLFHLIDGIENEKDQEIIKGLIASAKNNSLVAIQLFYKLWKKYPDDPAIWNDFIITVSKFKNDPFCFYLLNQFWEKFPLEETDHCHLWWWYLDCAEKYNDFEVLKKIPVNRMNSWIIFKSLIYVFCKYKMENQLNFLAENLKNSDHIEDDSSMLIDLDEAMETILFIRNYLSEQEEGYYFRFIHCMDEILKEIQETGYPLSQTEEMSGYIYEYVPRKSYGFIIGKDLQQYFFHREDLNQGKEKEIKEAFSMEKTSWQEPLVTADFEYCENIKGAKQAYNIF